MRIDSLATRARALAALGIESWQLRSRRGEPSESLPQSSSDQRPSVQSPRVQRSIVEVPEPLTIEAPIVEAPLVAGDWDALRQQVASCTRCGLHAERTQAVFGVGDIKAQWMVVGEAPGSEEDKRGEPFVGAAGQLLTAMLAAIDLPRESVFIANILKCRPPENRDPKPAEVAQCLPYLRRQIEWIQPRMILAFGRVAAQNLLGVEQPLSRLRGRVHHLPGTQTPVIVTYHPAYLLRVPADKRKAWEDLKFARRSFESVAQA
ncbi:MAG: uracil-DNA glycosylase [Gammaproteobacteria bacterium]|jgi:uracil-DNA glycosylase family 4|nr:uracil-DNA glycosylase [Gammaproteobacteria bacterium]